MVEMPAKPDNTIPTQNHLTTGQRVIAGARLARQLAAEGGIRQRAGGKVLEGSKGKSAALAAKQFGVSARAVELGLLVLGQGIPKLAQAVESGKVSVSSAAKLAKLSREAQQQALADIAEGRPVIEALVAAGVPRSKHTHFDDKSLSKAIGHLKEKLDLRAQAHGPNDHYRQARDQLKLFSSTIRRWRTQGLNDPEPLMVDARGQQVPLKFVPAFQTAEVIAIVCEQLEGIEKVVEGLFKRHGSELIHSPSVLSNLLHARKALSEAKPSIVCTRCNGTNRSCSLCLGQGWVPARGWNGGELMSGPQAQPCASTVIMR